MAYSTLWELQEIPKLLMGPICDMVRHAGLDSLVMHVNNYVVVYVTKRFVRNNRSLMRELRRMKVFLDNVDVRIPSEWLPSFMNIYTDALVRRLAGGDLRIHRSAINSILDIIRQRRVVFRYWPLGKSPAAAQEH